MSIDELIGVQQVRKEKTKEEYLLDVALKRRPVCAHYDAKIKKCTYNNCGMTCHFYDIQPHCPRYDGVR